MALQDHMDRAELTTEVFHAKLQALIARLRSGTIFRNLGRPAKLISRKKGTDTEGKATYIEEYELPLSTAGGGYIIYSIEYQGRGLAHAHIIWRPAKMPAKYERTSVRLSTTQPCALLLAPKRSRQHTSKRRRRVWACERVCVHEWHFSGS